MMVKNSFFIVFLSALCVSDAYAMLSLAKHARPGSQIRRISTKKDSPRTIEHIYKDVENIGDHACSDAFTTHNECKSMGCVRFAVTTAKNIHMQQRAQRKRDDYMFLLEAELSPKPHRLGISKMEEYAVKLGSRFAHLCKLEREAILLMQHVQIPANLEMKAISRKEEVGLGVKAPELLKQQIQAKNDIELYKKTFTLIAHKMRCIARQVNIIDANYDAKGNDAFAQEKQGVIEQHAAAKLFARNEIPESLKYLCYNACRWDHPDEIIMYSEPTEKE